MSLVYLPRGGIVVASEAADERSLSEALKRFDPDLVLTWELDDRGRQVYEVRKLVGRDRPALLVCRWTDDYGEPLPLSHALLDHVKQHQRGGRLAQWEEDERRRDESERAEAFEEALEIARDTLDRVSGKKLSPLHRGAHLRRSRHKPGGRWYP